MVREAVHVDALRRYYETPPGVPLFARILGQAYFAASNYFSRLHEDKPRQSGFVDRLHRSRIPVEKIVRFMTRKSEEEREMFDNIVTIQPTRRKQLQAMVATAPPALRIKRQQLFDKVRRKRELRRARITEVKDKVSTQAEKGRKVAVAIAAATAAVFK